MDADIYVLANNRNKKSLIKVLDKYLPNRIYQLGSQEGKFEFWDDSKEEGNQPSLFFCTEFDLFDFLENQSGILFRPSFRSTVQSDYRVLTLYYFEDDSLVVGLNMNQNSEQENIVLKELKQLLKSDYGYIAYHIPPVYGREAFINQCKILE